MLIQRYVYIVFFVIFFLKFLTSDLGFLGRLIGLSIEGLSFITLIIVFIAMGRGGVLLIPTKYFILFVVFFVSVVIGAFANGVQPGAVFSGLRNVFMYMPFFLIPAINRFNANQLEDQLRLILVFALIQIPLAFFQWFTGPKGKTMDHVEGSLDISSYLSIFMICCVAIIWSYYLGRRISLLLAGGLILLLLAPTTINETKGTLVLLPFSFLVPSLILAVQNRSYSMIAWSLVVVFGALSLFITAFSVFLSDLNTGDLAGFFSEGRFIDYLYSGASENAPRSFGVFNEVGRVDAIIFAISTISRDIVNLFFGFGVGNVSESYSAVTLGEYYRFEHLGPQISTVSIMLWETGFIGVAAVIIGCYFALKDAYSLSSRDSDFACFSRGWIAVVVVFFLSLPYKNLLISDVNGILFWYFTGVIASRLYDRRRNIGEGRSNGASP